MITFMGKMAENSSTKSPPPFSTSGSRQLIAVARTNGSSSVIARGVNARLTSLRCTSWSGGSMKIIMGSIARVSSDSTIVPSAELYKHRLLRSLEHVGVAGEREEPELVVAVAGIVVAQRAIGRVRIVVELVGERIQLHGRDRFTRGCFDEIGHLARAARGDRVERVRPPHGLDRRAPDRSRSCGRRGTRARCSPATISPWCS